MHMFKAAVHAHAVHAQAAQPALKMHQAAICMHNQTEPTNKGYKKTLSVCPATG